jgi:hypothetical protein
MDVGAGTAEAGDLAGGYRTASDHEARLLADVEKDR